MSRTTYTATATYALPVGWKCTNCGKINAKKCVVTAKGSASKYGAFHSQNTAKQLTNQATANARASVATYVANITANLESNKYPPIFNTCNCKACFHQEPWATIKANSRWIGICLAIALLSGILGILCILIEDWVTMGITLGIAVIFLGFIALSMKKSADYANKMKPVFENLKETEKPICTPGIEMLRIQMAGVFAQCPEDMVEINKAISRM